MIQSGVLFITGGSKGIGFSILKEALNSGYFVYNFSRTRPEVQHHKLKHLSADLSNPEQTVNLFSSVLDDCLTPQTPKQLVLINNAGILEPMNKVGKSVQVHQIHKHFAVNIISPIALAELFIHKTQNIDTYKIILNVGSGAADHFYEGWSNYGASKSALHYFSRTLALEQKSAQFPVVSCLFNPGRTDTNMQTQIRQASSEDFPLTDSFKKAFAEGKLNNPDRLAAALIRKLLKKEFQQGDEISHRELLA